MAMPSRTGVSLAIGIGLGLLAASLSAQQPGGQPTMPVVTGEVEVTTTRVPEAVEPVPAEITVVTAEQLEARGVRDMKDALAFVAGVTVAPGGESGPAGFVPELWGLREVDAFLLVVDGVPWGGAFNPAVTTLDLENVERIEVLRGAAPVMYGATAFSGVLHVIHRQPGDATRNARVWGGRFGSFGGAATLALPAHGDVRQSLTVDAETQGLADERAGFDRAHALYRASGAAMDGVWRFDADAIVQRQDPDSPHPRGNAVTVLDPRIPLDANHNPSDAKIDDDRIHLVGGFDREALGGSWATTLALTHTRRDTIRGFVRRDDISSAPDVEADGFSQASRFDDLYLDTHLALGAGAPVRFVVGVDALLGKGKQESDNFEYEIDLDGRGAPSSGSLHVDESTELEDERTFLGLYGQAEWQPTDRIQVVAGVRLNSTHEKLEGEAEEGGVDVPVTDSKSISRGSGVLGASWRAWGSEGEGVWLFGDYRQSFKPAAIDFGPEAEGDILEPETSKSFEAGLKGSHLERRLRWQVTAFDMKLRNLLLPQDARLINGGRMRFRGVDVEATWRWLDDLTWQVAAGRHDPEFEDFVQFFDGVPTQLRGNRPELAPEKLWSTGLVWAPATGLAAYAEYEWVGDRFLSRRNTVLAPSYSAWGAGVAYRLSRWELRLDGENLGDERAPVSESEIGDAQFYRLPARTVRLTAGMHF
jgi:iron complex outermembrane receptor protein